MLAALNRGPLARAALVLFLLPIATVISSWRLILISYYRIAAIGFSDRDYGDGLIGVVGKGTVAGLGVSIIISLLFLSSFIRI